MLSIVFAAVNFSHVLKRVPVCLNASVICSAGIVLAKEGGALGKMMPVFNIFAGGPLGSGRQWCSWIHRSAQMIPPSPSSNPLHSKASWLQNARQGGRIACPASSQEIGFMPKKPEV